MTPSSVQREKEMPDEERAKVEVPVGLNFWELYWVYMVLTSRLNSDRTIPIDLRDVYRSTADKLAAASVDHPMGWGVRSC